VKMNFGEAIRRSW